MAGDWIPIRTDLYETIEVVALSSRLKRDRFATVGHIIRFWAWANAQTADGHLPGLTCELLADCVGPDAQFYHEMVEVGWLTITAKGLAIPHYDRWLGRNAKKRLMARRRQQVSRSQRDKSVTTGQDRTGENNTPPIPPKNSSSNSQLVGHEWSFQCARIKNGYAQDAPSDIAHQFDELLKLGVPFDKLMAEVKNPNRDHSEHFWEFKKRMLAVHKKPAADGYKGPPSVEETMRRVREEQANAKKETPHDR